VLDRPGTAYGWGMSVKVDVGELEATLRDYRFAYLVTVGDGARAHVLAVSPVLHDGALVVDGVGRHSQANAAGHPEVTLVWPPPLPDGYSLLVDGSATVDGSTITIRPAKAVLHRPAPDAEGRRVGSDCVAVPLPEA
jgi:hypothetical protein